MEIIRKSILRHLRLSPSLYSENVNVLKGLSRLMCTSTSTNPDQVMDRVTALVKKFDRIDATKVTAKADFQKDLCLDSLDRVELVMAFEEEFSIDIPEDSAEKLMCCADVAKYILSQTELKKAEA